MWQGPELLAATPCAIPALGRCSGRPLSHMSQYQYCAPAMYPDPPPPVTPRPVQVSAKTEEEDIVQGLRCGQT